MKFWHRILKKFVFNLFYRNISSANYTHNKVSCIVYYRVSNLEMPYSKELLWLHFWSQAFFSIILMVEKSVHFDIWNKKFFENSKGPPYDLAIFQNLNLAENLKNEPNHRGDPLKFSKNFLFQISKCTNFSTIRMMEKNA